MICEYGCGQEAKYQFKNGKMCCSKNFGACPFHRKKRSIRAIKEKNPMYGKKRKFSKETRKRMSEGSKLTIENIKKQYPIFFDEEELRYNPNKDEIELQVHCKYSACPNSKENGGWFSPTGSQISERIRQLEKSWGNYGGFFYCSDKCKSSCQLYNNREHIRKEKNELPYSEKDWKVFRQHVLERDDYKCQYCGKLAEHVHHERAQKLEPFFTLDPDLAWSVCKYCHYKKAHKDECSTINLANKKCK